MLIDDDESVRTMLRHVLARGGYEVDTAIDGVDGLNRWRDDSFDLVVTDLFMPEDGLHMMRQMLQDDPDVRIIAMSGGGQLGLTQLLVAAGHLGARRTLKKPFPPNELLDAVAEVLGS